MEEDTKEEISRWYAVRSQLKREKLAAQKLRDLDGVEVFLPRIRYQKVTRRGPVWWVEPLFPSYLLVKFKLVEQGRLVGYSPGVSHVLKFGSVSPEVPAHLVDDLRSEWAKNKAEGDELTVERVVQPGDEVEVAKGAFQGMEGRVVAVRPSDQRVSMLMDFLGQERRIEVDILDLILERRLTENLHRSVD